MYNFTSELFKGLDCPYVVTVIPRIITKTYLGLMIESELTEISMPSNSVVTCVQVVDNGTSVLFHSKLNEPILGVTEFQIEFKLIRVGENITKPDRRFYLG